uniref:Uncharacterized protein n=1 Tax=Arundo donax TaxID=35708 RepID=A0A0A9EDR1_ARUDO
MSNSSNWSSSSNQVCTNGSSFYTLEATSAMQGERKIRLIFWYDLEVPYLGIRVNKFLSKKG